jgi:hypothetical protein
VNEKGYFFRLLKANRHLLTRQQYRTIKGQATAGDLYGAWAGLWKLLERRGADA